MKKQCYPYVIPIEYKEKIENETLFSETKRNQIENFVDNFYHSLTVKMRMLPCFNK